MQLRPTRPLPVGMSEYSLVMVLTTNCRHLASDAVSEMCQLKPWPSMRNVSLDKHGYLTTLKMRFGAYDDEHARTTSGAAVRAAMSAGKVQGVALMQHSRFLITAHSSMR